ncbi:MAG: hypothetical protein J7576_15560 [Siphonobacter aquaeclarae]|nr:hypothetical protein [Siphonobacter aquaeclarae]
MKAYALILLFWAAVFHGTLAQTPAPLQITRFAIAGIDDGRIDQKTRTISLTLPTGFSATTLVPTITITPNVQQISMVSGQPFELSIQEPITIQLSGGTAKTSYRLYIRGTLQPDLSDLLRVTISEGTQFVTIPMKGNSTLPAASDAKPSFITIRNTVTGETHQSPVIDHKNPYLWYLPCDLVSGVYEATLTTQGQTFTVSRQVVVTAGKPFLYAPGYFWKATSCRTDLTTTPGSPFVLKGRNFEAKADYRLELKNDFQSVTLPGTFADEQTLTFQIPATLATGTYQLQAFARNKPIPSAKETGGNERPQLIVGDYGGQAGIESVGDGAFKESATFRPGDAISFSCLGFGAGGAVKLVNAGASYLTPEGTLKSQLPSMTYRTLCRLSDTLPKGTYEVYVVKNGKQSARYRQKITIQ